MSMPMAITKETTASRIQLREQFDAILAATKSNGYQLEDIIPQNIQDRFGDVVELKDARRYNEQVEAREKELYAANEKLTAELEEKQAEIDCQPRVFEYLKVDVNQLNHQIEYYKKLADDATDRTVRYQARLQEAMKKQKFGDEISKKIERLEAAVEHHRAEIVKLVNENRVAVTIHDDMQESLKQALALKDEKIARLTASIQKIETDKSTTDEITEACNSLIDTLEAETNLTSAQLNEHSILVQRNEKQVSAAVCEIIPLNRFYDRAFDILRLYHSIFRRLADPRTMTIVHLPAQELDDLFWGADEDMYQYCEVHASIQSEGVAQDAMRVQVELLANHATRLHTSLGVMRDDTIGFLERIGREPSVWWALKARFV
jgi:hypothetical protein